MEAEKWMFYLPDGPIRLFNTYACLKEQGWEVGNGGAYAPVREGIELEFARLTGEGQLIGSVVLSINAALCAIIEGWITPTHLRAAHFDDHTAIVPGLTLLGFPKAVMIDGGFRGSYRLET